jgi:hypothetical protein
MLLPPQFQAAVSPGLRSLLLLMLACVDLWWKGAVVVKTPDLESPPAAVQWGSSEANDQAIVTTER